MVICGHLWPWVSLGIGSYAVFGFYMLSGYLMTLVLNGTYGFSFNGIFRFLMNRALRIYPPYFAVMAISLSVIFFIPLIAKDLNNALQWPSTAADWIYNIIILGLSPLRKTRLIPPAWSLFVELLFYIGMALFLSRHRLTVYLWFLASAAYTAFIVYANYDFKYRYYTVQSASLPFSAGALIYYLKDYVKSIPKWHAIHAPLLVLLNGVLADYLWGNVRMHGFYISFLLNAYVLICLNNLGKNDVPVWLSKTDKFFGDLSYPIFLCHWPVGVLTAWAFFRGNNSKGGHLFLSSFLFINLAGYLIHVLVEKRINKIRDTVKRPNKTILIRA